MSQAASSQLLPVQPDATADEAGAAYTPIFRAVSTPKQRRGIRLESIYWDGLKMLAADTGRSIGEVVEEVADSMPESGNLASLLRVRVVRWMSERVHALERATQAEAADAIIQACPSPAFALTADKKIVFHNRSLLGLIQSRFIAVQPDVMQKGLRLALDTRLDHVIEQLRGGAKSVPSGFVLGVEERRIRGTLNLVLAPVGRKPMVLAFITSA